MPDWGEAFGALGAALQTGGATYVDLKDRQRRQQIEDEDRKRRILLEDEDRDRQQKLLDMTLAESALNAAEPNQEVDPETAAIIERTPFRIRLRKQGTLPSRQFGSVEKEVPSRPSTTVRPTFQQQSELDEQSRMRDTLKRRDDFLREAEASGDPVMSMFARANAAGIQNPPVPFNEQLRRTKELGAVENKFAMDRINAQLARYSNPGGQSPEEKQHFSIFSSVLNSFLRENPDAMMDPDSPEAAEMFSAAKAAADFYTGKSFTGPRQTPPGPPASAPPDVLGGGESEGPGIGERIGNFFSEMTTTYLPSYCPPGTPQGVICSKDGRKKRGR